MIIEECTQFPLQCRNPSFRLEIGGHRNRDRNYRNAVAMKHGVGGHLLKGSNCFLGSKLGSLCITGVAHTSAEKPTELL